jgi:enoyl-CoA hydratase
MSEDLIRSRLDGPVGHLQLHRPEKANAYNRALLLGLRQALASWWDDDAVRVIVISGAGERAFCGGADLDEIARADHRAALDMLSAQVFGELAAYPKVTIAAINGAAVAGGLELALACDLRLAADQAWFSLPEPLLGLIPSAGGTQRLPQTVGLARARELILGGRVWSAEEALRHGLVSEVVEASRLGERAQAWALEIARRDPLALRLAKEALAAQAPGAHGFRLEAFAEALLYRLRQEKNREEREESEPDEH